MSQYRFTHQLVRSVGDDGSIYYTPTMIREGESVNNQSVQNVPSGEPEILDLPRMEFPKNEDKGQPKPAQNRTDEQIGDDYMNELPRMTF